MQRTWKRPTTILDSIDFDRVAPPFEGAHATYVIRSGTIAKSAVGRAIVVFAVVVGVAVGAIGASVAVALPSVLKLSLASPSGKLNTTPAPRASR